jgi:hypothetical protein
MKKIDDKILNEARVGDEQVKNQEDGADTVTCDCCNLSSSSPLSVTESGQQ